MAVLKCIFKSKRSGKIILDWNKCEASIVDIIHYNAELSRVRNLEGIREVPAQNIGKAVYFANTWQIYTNASYVELRAFYHGEIIKKRVSFTGVKNNTKGAGKDGYDFMDERFSEIYKTTIFKAFSGRKYKEFYEAIKACVPTQVDYVNKYAKRIRWHGCYKSDVSSAYPYQLTKKVPTLHDCKRVSGRVEPSAEYPFAFYINSHHLAIYGELNTLELGKSKYYSAFHDPTVKWKHSEDMKPEDDETILCKASAYSFDSIVSEMYNLRHSYDNMKLYSVAGIGYFHKNTNPILAHISAVVLARCASDMVKRAEQLEKEGNMVLLINTDSIIWRGKQSSLSERRKAFGAFSVEYEDCDVLITGVKAYQVQNKDGSGLITRHAGVDKQISRNMKFGDILNVSSDATTSDVFYIITETGEIEKIQ